MARWIVAIGLAPLLGCSTGREPTVTETRSVAPTSALGARDVLRALPGIAARLDAGGRLAASDGNFRLTRKGRWSSSTDLDVTLPGAADGELRVAGRGKEMWVGVRALGVGKVAGHVDGTSLVYDGAATDLDVVQIVAPERVEELRLLRSSRAPSTARYALRHGTGIVSLRVRDGRVEALDRDGSIVLRTEPAWAVDADGARRDVDVSLATEGPDRVLVASLDTTGLRFPIAVDPAWSAGLTDALAKRMDFASTSDGTNTYLLGGSSDGTDSLSTCVYFEGTKFVAMPSLNTPRRGAYAAWLTAGGSRLLIAAGGRNGATALSTIETWSTGASSWSVASATLASPRMDAAPYYVNGAATMASSTLYLFGGNDGTNLSCAPKSRKQPVNSGST